MGGIRELLDGKIWEWDLSFRWEWEWDGNGNEVIEMGGNWYEKSVPAHLYLTLTLTFCLQDTRPVKKTEWWGAAVVRCLQQGADLHMAQLMPLPVPLTVS